MDVVMPLMDGIEATKALHELLPELKILVMSSFQDPQSVHAMPLNGTLGYITKALSQGKAIPETSRSMMAKPIVPH